MSFTRIEFYKKIKMPLIHKPILILVFSVCFNTSYCQMTKLFTKNVNRQVTTDMKLNPITQPSKANSKFEIFFDKQAGYGYIKVTDYLLNEKWKMDLKEMYTGYAKGYKIYYFQSSDGKFKVSVSKEENGIAIGGYLSKEITVFYNE